MRADDLLATYPNAIHAIAWVELIMCPNSYGAYDGLGEMRAKGMSIDEVVAVMRECMQEEIEEGTRGMREALAETDTPDFRRYMAAKMGLV